MIEFALALPLLLMLLVFAIDFGRVFFGWVGLQNAARIGANYAASHADAWQTPDNPIKTGERLEFSNEILRDARSINCVLQTIPTPVFQAVGGVAAGEMGSHASVTLECDFRFILGAFGAALVGDPVRIGANAIFPVRSGAVANLPSPIPTPPPTPAPTPVCTQVPVVNGLSAPAAANSAITGAGLTPNGIGDLTTGPKGNASNQSPVAGTCVAPGSTVTYHYRP